jgi:hypothetical protein
MNLDMVVTFQMNKLKGEEITDNTVWMAKSHHPTVTEGCVPFYTN